MSNVEQEQAERLIVENRNEDGSYDIKGIAKDVTKLLRDMSTRKLEIPDLRQTHTVDNAVWHSKEVERGIRQIVKLCNQPILSRSKERDQEVENAVRGIIDAAVAEGIAQSSLEPVDEELRVTFINEAPGDKEWSAHINLLNDWQNPERTLRDIIQYARSGPFYSADMHVHLIEQWHVARLQAAVREARIDENKIALNILTEVSGSYIVFSGYDHGISEGYFEERLGQLKQENA